MACAGSTCCRGATDAGACRQSRLKPGWRDRLSAPLTDSVCAGCQPLDRRRDLCQVILGLQHKRGDLRPLERDGRTLRIVLVVSVGVVGGRHHLVEVAGQARKAPERLLSFRLEQLASPSIRQCLTLPPTEATPLDHCTAPRTVACPQGR